MRLHGVCVLMLLSACSIEERGAPGTNPDSRVDLSTGDDSVAVTLSAPAVARRGDDVPIVITVRNTTARPIELALAGRAIAFDITVSQNQTILWHRLAGQTVPAILQLKKLLPNEAFELIDRWRANVAPGEYVLEGKILTDADPLEPRPRHITVE